MQGYLLQDKISVSKLRSNRETHCRCKFPIVEFSGAWLATWLNYHHLDISGCGEQAVSNDS